MNIDMTTFFFKSNFEFSPSLLVYFLSLLFSSFGLLIQYLILLIFNYLFKITISSTQLIYWSGLIPGSLLPASPVSVFFLSFDRLVIYINNYIIILPLNENKECISFGCLTSNASRLIYSINRLIVSLPNFIIGSLFLFILFAYRKRLEKQQNNNNKENILINKSNKMGNRLALWVVIFEFLLDLLPNFINFILTAFFDINISVYVGAFRSLTFSLQTFFAALTHTIILWNIYNTNKTIIINRKTIINALLSKNYI
ncbi:hypothetical protein Mgra_00000092 [Meloidogyne graminicola]|uniref:G_PROTEIN_RECEP_F1_2 domain-containing protein n=1 Tax=Meloidogyne graminicola TaxID=189291 RepID=A0A8T0A2C5_9BILA|nr:hypothetical protein Mgra_00000092 [Meloidogyne graminicola]